MFRFCVITIYHISVPRWLSIIESCDMFFSMPFSCFLIWQAACHGSIGLFFQEKIDQYAKPDVGHETHGLEDEPWTMVGQALAAHVWSTVSKLALVFAICHSWMLTASANLEESCWRHRLQLACLAGFAFPAIPCRRKFPPRHRNLAAHDGSKVSGTKGDYPHKIRDFGRFWRHFFFIKEFSPVKWFVYRSQALH